MLRPAHVSVALVAIAFAAYACSSTEEGAPAGPGDDAGTGTVDDGSTTPPSNDGSSGGPPPVLDDAGPDASDVNPIATAAAPVAVTPVDFTGFADGPIFQDGALFFSDVTSSVIVRLTPPDTFVQIRRAVDIAPRYPIGTTLDGKTGVLLTAESEPNVVPTNRIARWFTDGGAATPASVTFDGGAPLWNSPNDVVVRASDGTIYVSDPGYQAGVITNKIIRIAPGGGTSIEKAFAGGDRPNGLALSPDAATLYVSFTATNVVKQYPLAADGALGAEAQFANVTPSPDGLGIDEAGNVYVASGTGISVFNAAGTLWGTIPTTKPATAVAFGGPDRKTLYITADGAVYAVTGLTVAGLVQ